MEIPALSPATVFAGYPGRRKLSPAARRFVAILDAGTFDTVTARRSAVGFRGRDSNIINRLVIG